MLNAGIWGCCNYVHLKKEESHTLQELRCNNLINEKRTFPKTSCLHQGYSIIASELLECVALLLFFMCSTPLASTSPKQVCVSCADKWGYGNANYV